ncbi:MAG: acetyl-CoA hydrolase/transferase C-terminal domain-containing protein, partial [Pseudomonadota bacterium]
RARRESRGKVSSNILWNYGHTTVPRHHRDVYVTEYGVAATRGCSDRDIVDRLLHVADADFHPELLESAKRAGKIDADYKMADDAGNNRPEVIAAVFDKHRQYFPPYPLGTALTPDEVSLAEALTWLQRETATTGGKLRRAAHALFASVEERHAGPLERMGLAKPENFGQRIMRGMLTEALTRTQQ